MSKVSKTIKEFTRRDFIGSTDKGSVSRSKDVPSVKYSGIDREFSIYFTARSASDSSTSYIVKVKLEDIAEIAAEPDMTIQEKVRLALDGDLKVYCSCPAYRYWGYEYINTQLGSNDGPDQERYPHVRNPNLEGVLCKHCYKTMQVLPMVWNSISSDIDRDKWVKF